MQQLQKPRQGYKLVKFFFGRDEEIPEVWEVADFKDLVDFQEGPGLRTWQFRRISMKVINVTNLVDGRLDLSLTNRHIDLQEFHKNYSHFAVEENDIVVASSGNSYGKVAVVRKVDLPLMMNTSVIRLKPLRTEFLNRKFLEYFLQSKLFKDQIDIMITGPAQPVCGTPGGGEDIPETKILLPIGIC